MLAHRAGLCLWPVAVFVVAACGACTAAALPQVVSYPQVSASPVIADNTTSYTVTTTISDADGYNDIVDIRTLFDFTEAGGDQSKGRGYLAWATADSYMTRYGGTWVIANAGGYGRWGYMTDGWGGTTYITPVSCTASTSGSASGATGTVTVTWTFKAKSAWAMNPLTNDADLWFADAANNRRGWLDSPNEFEVVIAPCTDYCTTPHQPIVSGATTSTVNVQISPQDTDSDLYAIRFSPAVLTRDYVQADGTLGGSPVFRSKADWGTTSVTGLPTNTQFAAKARAARTDPGWCPSGWSDGAAFETAVLTRNIDPAAPGETINKGVMGNNALAWKASAQRESDNIAACVNTSIRWGGDGYDWKTRTAQWDSGTQSTLLRLRQARDRNSFLLNLTNTRGIGTGNGATWVYTDMSAATLASLTADWVFYCNKLVQTKRQGDALDAREQAVLDSMQWGTDEKLLQPGEAMVPKVMLWEIGNEPEGPYPPPALSVEEYAAKYKTISQAVVAEDPTVMVGPCIMSADSGNAWLDAILADPQNQVDFICYHPYGLLYWYTKAYSGGVLNANDLNSALNQLRQQQINRRQKVIDRLAANSRPLTTPLIASEFNPSSWEGTYYYNLSRTMAHAIGLIETVFTFADLGFLGAQYWDRPNWPSTTAIEAPGFKAIKTIQTYMGDKLIDVFTEPDFRLYSTLDDETGRVVIWALNLSESRDKTLRIQIPAGTGLNSLTQHRLAMPTGYTSLASLNKPNDTYEKIVWTTTDLTDTVNLTDFTLTFPRATLTMLRLDPALKSMPDKTALTLAGKSVTAVYSGENYLYIEQDNRAYGIRVAGTCSGIAVGDRVTVNGKLDTRKPDGETASERYISADSIVKLSSDTALKPLGMNCRSVGGGAGSGTVGVKEGFGLSNVGLLVKIAGVVKEVVDGQHMYVDDGSSVPDIDGKIGVLVKCPSTSEYSADETVMVTGVIEGSVPDGWNENRRFIRARSTADVRHVLP